MCAVWSPVCSPHAWSAWMKSPLRKKQRDSNGVRMRGVNTDLSAAHTDSTEETWGNGCFWAPLKKTLLVRLSVTYNEGVKDKEKRDLLDACQLKWYTRSLINNMVLMTISNLNYGFIIAYFYQYFKMKWNQNKHANCCQERKGWEEPKNFGKPEKPDLQCKLFYLILFYQPFPSILRGFGTNRQAHGQTDSQMQTQLQVQNA